MLETIAFATMMVSQKPMTKTEEFFSSVGSDFRSELVDTSKIKNIYRSRRFANRSRNREKLVSTFIIPVINGNLICDPQHDLIMQIENYGNILKSRFEDASRVYDSSMIDKMISAIKSIPSGIPTPKPMLSDSGELGLYWDVDQVFADLELESNGQFSFFIRKKGEEATEKFIDGIDVENLTFIPLAEALRLAYDA